MSDLLSTLFSVLFTVYVIIAVLGGSAFLLKAAYMPHVTKHYFEHVSRDNGGTPWSRFFSELARISVLWPLWLLALATQNWWKPKLSKQLRSEQEQSEQTQKDS
ncbi:hypothetical protein [Streptosporangium saharense]|uniref:hypothetical protein n=1 Tax=Streptosporangium saharense TaxID=1706840 RepID=UPI003420D599